MDKKLNGYGVELGVASGHFSDHILKNSRLKLLFSIDRWNDHHTHEEYIRAANMLNQHRERSVILKMPFEEAIHLFKDELFDFIYIDRKFDREVSFSQALFCNIPRIEIKYTYN